MTIWILYLLLTVQPPAPRGVGHVSLTLAHKFKTKKSCEFFGRAEVHRLANVGGWDENQQFASVSFSCETGVPRGGMLSLGGDSPGKMTIGSGIGGTNGTAGAGGHITLLAGEAHKSGVYLSDGGEVPPCPAHGPYTFSCVEYPDGGTP